LIAKALDFQDKRYIMDASDIDPRMTVRDLPVAATAGFLFLDLS